MADNSSGPEYTLSSWDNCMSRAYCKWPVIVGIILGSIIALSIIWCVLKCICGGIADCCCGCCDCCSDRRRNNNYGYQQPPPPPPQYPMYNQYQRPQQPPPPPPQYPMYNQYQRPQQPMYSAAPMYAPSPMYAPPPQMSGGAGFRGAPTSPHEGPNKSGATANYNEDALPPMPSWSHGRDRQIEDGDMEMGHMQSPHAGQQQGLLSPTGTGGHYEQQSHGGDMGAMHAAPAHNYDAHRQFAPQSIYSQDTVSQGPNRVTSMRSTQYEPSLYPPSYHTQVPGNHTALAAGAVSPPPAGHTIGRKPVQGTWRDV